MMKKNFLMFCAASAIVVFSAACAKKPSASFKLSKTTAAVGESITATFDGEETNAYLWSAWDGSVSTQTGSSSGNVTSISGEVVAMILGLSVLRLRAPIRFG